MQKTGGANRNNVLAADCDYTSGANGAGLGSMKWPQAMVCYISGLMRAAIIFAIFTSTEILAGQGGWLLIIPPIVTGPLKVDTGAPLAQWGILERFDYVENCEHKVSHIIGNVHDRTWLAEREKEYRDLGPGTPLRPRTSEFAKKTLEAAKCVSADDPRLKQPSWHTQPHS
jgi:hypothetical protein